MSKYIDELIADIKTNPNSWKRYKNGGIMKNNIQITDLGNTPIFSVISVWVNQTYVPMTYQDKWRIESAVRKWFKIVSLEKICEL